MQTLVQFYIEQGFCCVSNQFFCEISTKNYSTENKVIGFGSFSLHICRNNV